LLLIRHSYGSRAWMPPGGAMSRGEDRLSAAGRELAEETGLILRDARLAIAAGSHPRGIGSRTQVVVGHVDGVPVPDQREVVAAAFFARDALPDDVPDGLVARIARYLADIDPG
jgi:ADP-ribose pyrophosphatase YjhB (NUDIX family)